MPRAGAAAQISRADQEIAAVKLAFCRSGMEIAKLAAQKAESDEVKQFAAKMLKEHTEGCANLEKWAGNLAPAQGRTLPAPVDRAEADGRQPVARPAPGAALNWVMIQQQLAEQCLASAKQELAKKEGADFDKCFMFMAIGGHQQAVDADHVFKNHASPQFQGEVEECLKTASMHLAEAKEIMGKLTGESPRLTRKPDDDFPPRRRAGRSRAVTPEGYRSVSSRDRLWSRLSSFMDRD